MLIHFVDGHLSVPTLEIQGEEPAGIEQVIDVWQRLRILDCGRIQLPKV